MAQSRRPKAVVNREAVLDALVRLGGSAGVKAIALEARLDTNRVVAVLPTLGTVECVEGSGVNATWRLKPSGNTATGDIHLPGVAP